ncbi:hypothetical protein Sfum_3266 [Syntrophobacter fumaroxidans MPOB]|uniref:Uncharacterized protein n=2 Tax=Syntrophobacter TaxID=29526 RepID=A0LND7_SYNFM|nr:hypothetical protein Sfum_3266 [Syntrophobacter fumaroxidans MPOB]
MIMTKQLTVVSGRKPGKGRKVLLPAEKFKHHRKVTGVVLQGAQDAWAELWQELQGTVTDGVMILPEAEKGFKPKCGWPEFLEKMWLLKHQIDYAKRFSEGTTVVTMHADKDSRAME